MARTKEFDTVLVLHKAMEVFGHYGYDGTTLQHLLDGLGIARQSLYDTYGTKRDLFLMAVKHYVNSKSDAVVEYLDRPGPVVESIGRIFTEIAAVLKDPERQKECFILHSAIDQVPHEPEIAELFRRDMERLEGAFHRALLRAQEQGELQGQQDLRALARYLYHARYSLTQTAKLTSDPGVLDQVTTVTLSLLKNQ